MRAKDLQALIDYRLQRATETLVEARLMQNAKHWNSCANRLYYAAFYAVSALLVKDGHAASKHSGVKALFNQYYVKPGTIEKDKGRLYNRLFDLRQEGDYIDFVTLDAEKVEPLVAETVVFIETIRVLLL
ncbi:MAG: HEPN domain-containing protein [Anaerolineales bacterium]|nr:HEPN domain-containing protein [Anaerolineales bacterium]MCA9965491.1 HEPN domain-containing protein [Anaerolineales bacterium]